MGFTAKLDSLRSELEEAHGLQLADIKDALRREYDSEMHDWSEKYDRLTEELDACRKDKSNLEAQTKNWETSYEQLRRETLKYRDEVTKSFQALQTEYERLNGRLEEEKKRNGGWEETKRSLEAELKTLSDEKIFNERKLGDENEALIESNKELGLRLADMTESME